MFFGSGKFHDHDPVMGMVLGPKPTEHDSTAKVIQVNLASRSA